MGCNEEEPSAITVIAQTPSLPPQTEHLEMKIYTRICIFIYGVKHSSAQRATKQTEHQIPTWECNTTPNCKPTSLLPKLLHVFCCLCREGRREWISRAAHSAAFGRPVLPQNPCNSGWRAGVNRKPIKHCAPRGLRLVPKSVKAGPAMCALCMTSHCSHLPASFLQQRDTNLCWKIFFKTRKTIKTAAGEGCKRRTRKENCTGSGYILSALDLSQKENKTLI